MRKLFLLVCCAIVPTATAAGSPALAGTVKMPIYNTGVDNSGMALGPILQDPHWTIGGAQAFTSYDPGGGWVANNTSGPNQSAWIGSTDSPSVTYTFLQTFLLPANATQLSLEGQWATDDLGMLYLNDQEILGSATQFLPDPWTGFKSFSVSDPSFFNLGGTNTLKAVIDNIGGGPTGFQAQFNGSYTPAVPGPLPLLGAGAAFGFSRRLRRRLRQSSLCTPELHSTRG